MSYENQNRILQQHSVQRACTEPTPQGKGALERYLSYHSATAGTSAKLNVKIHANVHCFKLTLTIGPRCQDAADLREPRRS